MEAPPLALQVDPARRYATLTFLRGAVAAICISVLAGLLGAFYYIPQMAPVLQGLGIQFAALRPLHTTFAVVFILLGGMAVVHRFFEDIAGPMGAGEKLRLRIQLISWAVAGVGVFGTILIGVGSGREYMGFHPIFSLPIALGWLMFTWNYFSHVARGFMARPIHATMWGVGSLFFLYTFSEQHAWLLPDVFSEPIIDMRLQWKATGTLVGSFNLFVYGTLYYVACKLSGCERYAHSRLAYALFAIGLLNSFTNFAHHTYHLPQSHTVKWISFVVSMAEIILFFRVIVDITAMVKSSKPSPPCGIRAFLTAAKWWTGFILGTSLIISIPPVNSLVHGTQIVMAHAMGAEIGIDCMALFAGITWILSEIQGRRGVVSTVFGTEGYRKLIKGLNVGVIGLVGWLTISGAGTSIRRYEGLASPSWITNAGPWVFAVCGIIAAYFLMRLMVIWIGVVRR
ncbi:MAG: cbb3-type cytochrome c oxidase subunit I [Planctomycetes bacterium]|nr:cbb3-type cytochrome c oxidase subunit I [Planctomycetota bacterium]MCP4770361.1 cbb3-type cytochrome c oxidase subunit I [Planctomycetota bacterium]MCP4860547.1 cbb3-type cytochrome c oxidase subunit I [Planctomycetota bacterium]